jgi:hypothetical protein
MSTSLLLLSSPPRLATSFNNSQLTVEKREGAVGYKNKDLSTVCTVLAH